MTVAEALRYRQEQLAQVSTSAFLDAEVLLAFVLQKTRAYCLAHTEVCLSEQQHVKYCDLIERRIAGTPIAYLVGSKEFYGRNFLVDGRVLVPRPETELIIDTIKQYITSGLDAENELQILDVGTGSGCIAVTIKKELPLTSVTAIDISADALVVAKKNAVCLEADITFRQSDLFTAIACDDKYNIIASNPPYVKAANIKGATPETLSLRHEPRVALTPLGSNDAFAIIDQLLTQAVSHITKPGLIIIEIGEHQGKQALQTSRQLFGNADIAIMPDLAGLDRILVIKIQ